MSDKNYTPDWEVYFCDLDGSPACISVDLGLQERAPLEDKFQVFELVVGFEDVDADGFPANEADWEVLGQIEDELVQELESNLAAVFVGKLLHQGKRNFYFYSSHEALLSAYTSNIMQQFPGYSYSTNTQEDTGWSLYFDFLYPEPAIMQNIQNGKLVRLLQEEGDQPHIPRKVSHWIFFQNEADRENYWQTALVLGYTLEEKDTTEKATEDKYKLVVSKESTADEDTINHASMELWQLAINCNGNYDGWEAPLIREND